MDAGHCMYNLFLNSLGYGAVPYLWTKLRDDPGFFRGRLGFFDAGSPRQGKPRIWFHAASVGEVTGAIPTCHALKNELPGAAVCLTVGTPQGFRFARRQLPLDIQVLPFPLDFPWVLKRTFRVIKPDLYAAFESELWPNLFHLLKRKGVPAILLNGRISDRSAAAYRVLRPFFEPIFRQFQWLAMHAETDRVNAVSLGAPADRTLVLGSSKYDGLSSRVNSARVDYWREKLRISPHSPAVVGGSLRGMECIELLRVFRSLYALNSEAVGIFVPRHLHRIPAMVEWLQERGISYHLLSNLEKGSEERLSPIVLVDRIGILFDLYGLGSLVFCGGTLEPVGGHNILEPAAWKKPVFYGPYLKKVEHEHRILQAFGGSFPVRDGEDLLDLWKYWIVHLPKLNIHGENAGRALESLSGAASRHIALIMNTLSETRYPALTRHA